MIRSKAEAFRIRQAKMRAAVAAAPPAAEQTAIARLAAMGYRNVAAMGSALAAPSRPSDDDLLDDFMNDADFEFARRLSFGGTEE